MVNRVRKGSSSLLFSKQLEGSLLFSLPSPVYSSHFRGGQKELKETAGGRAKGKGEGVCSTIS